MITEFGWRNLKICINSSKGRHNMPSFLFNLMSKSMSDVSTNPNTAAWATALVALSAVLYGSLAFLGTKLVQLDFSISTMLFWRFFVATLWMVVVAFFSKEK